jgi:hypothetical protein
MALTAAHFRLRANEAKDLAMKTPDSVFSGLLREIAQSYEVLAVNEDWRESKYGRLARVLSNDRAAVLAPSSVHARSKPYGYER